MTTIPHATIAPSGSRFAADIARHAPTWAVGYPTAARRRDFLDMASGIARICHPHDREAAQDLVVEMTFAWLEALRTEADESARAETDERAERFAALDPIRPASIQSSRRPPLAPPALAAFFRRPTCRRPIDRPSRRPAPRASDDDSPADRALVEVVR